MGKVFVLAGLGYGDEGKGTITDFLVDKFKVQTVVRYNGGPQCGDDVITPDGKHHTFTQFGSGTFAGATTYLSEHMLVDPLALIPEAAHLREVGISNPFDLLEVDVRCPIVTPFQRAVNRLKERQRGNGRHGSCGVGLSELVIDMTHLPEDEHFLIGDLSKPGVVAQKLDNYRKVNFKKILEYLGEVPDGDPLKEVLLDSDTSRLVNRYVAVGELLKKRSSGRLTDLLKAPVTVFEGAQGVLLDQYWGFQPHTTWSDITYTNADTILNTHVPMRHEVEYIGIMRAHASRHGAGPFVTEEDLGEMYNDPYNNPSEWQGSFRVGHVDMVSARYACKVLGKVTAIAVTNLDRPSKLACVRYVGDKSGIDKEGQIIKTEKPDFFFQEKLTQVLSKAYPVYRSVQKDEGGEGIGWGLPQIGIVSFGTTRKDKRLLEKKTSGEPTGWTVK